MSRALRTVQMDETLLQTLGQTHPQPRHEDDRRSQAKRWAAL